jgi:hypothetical protein
VKPDLTTLHEELASVVLVGRNLADVLSEITTVGRRAMPGTDAASITLIRGESAFTATYDGQLALDADELQYERGYGPCMDAARAGQVFLIDDMRTEQRWPDLAHMRTAMMSRAVIEQAKGMLMERHRLTDDQAFTMLTHASQQTNVKLRDVAAGLVRTGAPRGGR